VRGLGAHAGGTIGFTSDYTPRARGPMRQARSARRRSRAASETRSSASISNTVRRRVRGGRLLRPGSRARGAVEVVTRRAEERRHAARGVPIPCRLRRLEVLHALASTENAEDRLERPCRASESLGRYCTARRSSGRQAASDTRRARRSPPRAVRSARVTPFTRWRATICRHSARERRRREVSPSDDACARVVESSAGTPRRG
jgi:hypothetical protein